MSFAIIRNEKYKRNELKGIYRHNERKNLNYSNKEIDKSKFKQNYHLKKPRYSYELEFDRLFQQNNLQGQIHHNSILACEYVITSDNEFFKNIGEEETKRFFQVAYEFVCKYKELGSQNIISAVVHNDETTPHLHITYIPVVHTLNKNKEPINKVLASQFWKGKDSYKKLQDNFYKYITENGFDLERGRSKGAEHLSTEKLKQVTNYENIKYELQENEKEELNTNNMQMIVAQNKELQAYNKKLKILLAKAMRAIEQVSILKKENIELREENLKLKKENMILKKYIEKTYEYISILINVPKQRIKNMIGNFIKELKSSEEK